MIIHIDRDYEVKCTLGTIRDMERVFQKSFVTILSELNKMTATDQIKMLYIGALRADSRLQESEFVRACEENMGLGELTEFMEQFILQLQYPGKTEGEIQEKIEKKLQRVEQLKSSAATLL